jgi:hypothetical protein|tara:strand:+ start:338 stop:496 length:159 start_codon:yes stop_codon:yes gene_type:complete
MGIRSEEHFEAQHVLRCIKLHRTVEIGRNVDEETRARCHLPHRPPLVSFVEV